MGWLSGVPGGALVFSKLVGRAAPYTGTIGARVVELSPGYAKVLLRDRPAVRNHLRSVHAIALANLAELCGNIAVAYSLHPDARFIVAGMRLEYLKKARGTLIAEARPEVPTGPETKDIDVLVEIRDAASDICTRAVLQTRIGPKKA